jgi:hypothetical protein
MFCAPGLVFGDTEGVGSRFKVLRARTYFRRYRGRRFPFLRFALPDSFSAVPRTSCPVLMFCVPGLVFGCTGGVVSCFHVLLARTRFRRYRGLRVPFSSFGVPRLVFGDTEVVVSLFHVLCAWTRFRRYRGSRAPFSCFAHPNSFSAVQRASYPVFMFCAPGVVFGDTEGFVSRIHVLCARTRFRRYRGRRVPFSCFARPDSFSAVSRASCPVFQVLRALTHFRRYRGRR